MHSSTTSDSSASLLTVREVAERLHVSTRCVYQLIDEGRLGCHRIGLGRGRLRVAPRELDRFLAGCEREMRGQEAQPARAPVRLKHLRE